MNILHVTRSHKKNENVVPRRVFESPKPPMRLAAGLPPARTRWGSLSAPADPLAAIRGGVLVLRGREGRGEEKRREGEGKKRKEMVWGGVACLLFI